VGTLVQVSPLLIEPDDERLTTLCVALRAEGIDVIAVTRIAEVERWPAGDIVVTSDESVGSWWRDVGAAAVIVLSDTPESDGCADGRTVWIHRNCPPPDLATVIHRLAVRGST